MVVKLHLLVVVVRLEVTARRRCACHCTSLFRLWRSVIATEALTIYIVVIVLTVVWQIERLVIVLDGLQLLIVLILVIDSHTVSFIACNTVIRLWVYVVLFCLIAYGF